MHRVQHQHVAAGMILCTFEIHKQTCTSSQWRWYITGAKHIINSSELHKYSGDGDVGALLDWVYYHDIMARFSALHWRRPGKDTNQYLPMMRTHW